MKIPLVNMTLINSPMNWALILLMSAIGAFAVTILTNQLTPDQQS